MAAQVHHFGWFIRARRQAKKLSIRRIAELAGISEKRLWQIEQKETPDIYGDTFEGIAKALGYASAEELDGVWREQAVAAKPPKKREGLVYLPPDVVESLGKVRRKEMSLTDAVVSILRDWLTSAAAAAPALPAPGPPQPEYRPPMIVDYGEDGKPIFEAQIPQGVPDVVEPGEERPAKPARRKKRRTKRRGDSKGSTSPV